MGEFFKILSKQKKAILAYIVLFFILTLFIHSIFKPKFYGFEFSVPIIVVILLIDIILTYKFKYRK